MTGVYLTSSVKKLKDLSVFKIVNYFKWKNSNIKDYNYIIKSKVYVEFKKKKKAISKKHVNYIKGNAGRYR